jgi:hypothetical protein
MTCGALGEGMTEVELSAGSILSEDSGGQGPVVVLVPWAADDGLVLGWGRGRAGAGRWVGSATLPLGAHRRPMPAEADLSLGGQVRLLVEVLERLGLEEVTLVFNDWCGARLLVAEGWVGRVGRVVLASWATDDNCPPGRPGRVAVLAGFRRPEDPCGLQGDWPAWAEGLLDDPGEEPAS